MTMFLTSFDDELMKLAGPRPMDFSKEMRTGLPVRPTKRLGTGSYAPKETAPSKETASARAKRGAGFRAMSRKAFRGGAPVKPSQRLSVNPSGAGRRQMPFAVASGGVTKR